MHLRKSYKKSGFGKLPVKFIIFTFIALAVYVCINVISSTSVFSVKVDMFIKMQSVREKLVNLSFKESTDNISDTDTLESFPAYESERERGEQRAYNNVNETSLSGDIQSLASDENNKPANYVDLDKYEIGRSVKRYNDSTGKKIHQIAESSEMGKRKKAQIMQDKQIVENITIIRELNTSVFKVNGEHNNPGIVGVEANERKTKSKPIDVFGNIVNESDNTRKADCDNCFMHIFNYVIENDICKLRDSDEEIELLILITTTHKNVKARAALRATWLSFTKRNTESIRYAFLLGESNDLRYRENILKEDNSFHDIIKEDFVDSYMNLTYKTIMGFKWAATKCAHAQFVMKTDDDMFVNVPNVLKIIRSPLGDALQHGLAGTCNLKAKPIRNKKSKWFASVKSYPQETYPGFCSGTGYVTSMNVVTEIYKISPNVPFFHLEDVYVALCVRKLGFSLQRVLGFNSGRPRLDPCIYKGNRLVTAHQMTPLMLQMIWRRQCARFRIY